MAVIQKCLVRVGLCALLLIPVAAGSADLREVVVDRDSNRYSLVSETWFAASKEDLYRVLTDYELFEKFTSAFVESRNVEPDGEGKPRFYTRMEGCVLFWCRSFIRRGHLELTPMSEIVSITDPDQSDFDFARERWRLFDEGDGTLIIYEFEMEPSFWVPPVIGPYMIQRSLKTGGSNAVNRIEALAQGKEPTF